jgi:hypothetical protein
VLGLTGLLLAGCGKSGPAGEATPAAVSAAAVSSAPSPAIANPDALAPAVDPAVDGRPEPVKLADFSTRLQAQRDVLATADSQLIGQVRGALQRGAQADARAALTAYSGLVANLIAATAQPPRFTGCLLKASAPSVQAHDTLAALLAVRRDKVRTVLAVTYRPLALADLAALASDTSSPSGTDPVETGLASAQAAATACAAAQNRPVRVAAPRHARERYVVPYSTASEPEAPPAVEPPRAEPVPTPTAPPPPPVKHKPNLLERLFSGGNHPN